MAIKVYGSNLCPATLQTLSIFTANHYMPLFVNITGSISTMKEYMLLHETNECFASIKGTNSLGFPFFELEDGTLTRDAKKAFASVGIDAELRYDN